VLEGRGELVLLQRGLAARGPLFSVGGARGEGALVGLKALVEPPVQAQKQPLLPPQEPQPEQVSQHESQSQSQSQQELQQAPGEQSQEQEQGVGAVGGLEQIRVPQEQLQAQLQLLPPALQSVQPGILEVDSEGVQGVLQPGQHAFSLPRPHLSAPLIGPSGAPLDLEALQGGGRGVHKLPVVAPL